MRRGWTLVSVALVIVAAGGVQASDIQAGVAQDTLTLPRGIPLAGYSKRHGRPAKGVHDPIMIRALVLRDEATCAVLVSADLLIIDERLYETVRGQLAAQGLPASCVLVTAATHTHSGPGGYGARFLEKLSMGHFDPAVFERIAQAIVRAIIRADHTRAPVRVAYGTAPVDGIVKNRVDPQGLVERDLTVTALYPATGSAPRAILVGFAAHPTTLGAWNMLLSADYPGVLAREVERRVPGSTCLFFAGAAGDQAPVKAGTGFERAEWIGVMLGDRVAALVKELAPELPHGLAARQIEVSLPRASVRLGKRLRLPHWLGRRLVDEDATLSLVTLGPVAFFGTPCDLASELGARLKAAARGHHRHAFIIGFASDYIGYCVTEARYGNAEYESLMAFNGPRAGEELVDRLIQMLDESVTSDDPPHERPR